MRSDAELVRAARSDPAAFRELYGRYARQIYGFHVRRVRDIDAAHELTAETFAQAWQSRRRFRDRASGSAGPWLIGIARHVIAQSVRRRRVELAACTKLGVLERLDGPRSTVEPEESWLEGLDEALDAVRSSCAWSTGFRTTTSRSSSPRRRGPRASASRAVLAASGLG